MEADELLKPNHSIIRSKLGLMFAALFALSLVVVSPAAALDAGAIRAKSYDLTIRPEFDKPSVLVINSAVLTNTSDQPFSGYVGFRVPKGAELQMVCEITSGGGHACQPFKTEDRGDYLEITWKNTRPIVKGEDFPVYVEYYYDPFESKSPRRFTFQLNPIYPMDNLNVTVTQPKGATDFRLDPSAASSQSAPGGLVDWYYRYTNLPSDPLRIAVSYTKTDDALSVTPNTKDQTASSAGPNTSAEPPAASNARPNLAMIVGILMAVALGAVAFALSRGDGRGRSRKR